MAHTNARHRLSEFVCSFLLNVGCVEKEELVNLVLIHVNNNYSSDPQSSSRNQYEAADDRSNPFDQIKNTCQNLFTTFTEKIATGERH